MDFFKEQFRAPPLPGSVTDLCHKATDDLLGTNADWALFMDIVDRVQTANDEVLLEAVRAVRRLLASNKHNTVMLTLMLIEALVKNSQRFREGCNNEKFCNCMLKVWEKGNKGGHDNLQVCSMTGTCVASVYRIARGELGARDSHHRLPCDACKSHPQPPSQEAEKVLVLVQQWGEAKVNNAFIATYQKLLARRVRFPTPTADEQPPVFTPAVSAAMTAAYAGADQHAARAAADAAAHHQQPYGNDNGNGNGNDNHARRPSQAQVERMIGTGGAAQVRVCQSNHARYRCMKNSWTQHHPSPRTHPCWQTVRDGVPRRARAALRDAAAASHDASVVGNKGGGRECHGTCGELQRASRDDAARRGDCDDERERGGASPRAGAQRGAQHRPADVRQVLYRRPATERGKIPPGW